MSDKNDAQPSTSNVDQRRGDLDAREEAVWANLRRRLATQAGSGVGVAVTLGSATKAVVFARREGNTAYGVTITPSWSTTYYVAAADKATTGFTVHFGTVAPANATFDWTSFRAG